MEFPGSSSAGYGTFYHINFIDFTIVWYLEWNKMIWKHPVFEKCILFVIFKWKISLHGVLFEN